MDYAILAVSGALAVLVVRMLFMRARVQTELMHDLNDLTAAHEGFISKLDGLERTLTDIGGPASELESETRETDADLTWTASDSSGLADPGALLIFGHLTRKLRYMALDDLVTEWPSTTAEDTDLEEDDGSYMRREPVAAHVQ